MPDERGGVQTRDEDVDVRVDADCEVAFVGKETTEEVS